MQENPIDATQLNQRIGALGMRLDRLSRIVGMMKNELRRERLRDASQRRADIDKHLSSMENLMRLTVVNQMLDKTDRAVDTLKAFKYDKNDFNALLRAARERGDGRGCYRRGCGVRSDRRQSDVLRGYRNEEVDRRQSDARRGR